jgi:hypothetical protein
LTLNSTSEDWIDFYYFFCIFCKVNSTQYLLPPSAYEMTVRKEKRVREVIPSDSSKYGPSDLSKYGRLNKVQQNYIKECHKQAKDSYNFSSQRSDETLTVDIWYKPSYHVNYKSPNFNVSHFYKKPVLLCVPHMQFKNADLRCPRDDCIGATVVPNAWCSSYRYVHDINEGIYLSQYMYHCKTCGTRSPALECIVEDWMRQCYPVEASSYTTNLVNFLMSCTTSSASMDEAIHYLGQIRATHYLQRRIQYEGLLKMRKRWKEKLRTDHGMQYHLLFGAAEEIDHTFSKFDAVEGYNEIAHIQNNTAVNVVKSFVDRQKDLITAVKKHEPLIVSMPLSTNITKTV